MLNHVALAVSDRPRSAAFYAEHFGFTETEWQDDGRFTRVQVSDPDGYLVEVYAH
jgi:catechol 2,3-dioxygenase-like lactoylglutathione lyase family enzyme